MIRVGIIGLGGMGFMHFGVYDKLESAEVVALADLDEDKLKPGAGSLEINIGEGGAVIDPQKQKLYTNPDELIADENVDLVDICLPTPLHPSYCIKVAASGKHILCEKPMALTSKECEQVLTALEKSQSKMMVAQCIRFWPHYVYLKDTVESGRLGALRSLSMFRGGALPTWTWQNWMVDAAKSGGALLDLHIHDADFVHYLLGRPEAVCSSVVGTADGVETLYIYDEPISVRAGAFWCMPPGFGFEMSYRAVFEQGCVIFDLRADEFVEIVGDDVSHPEVSKEDGYQAEISYLIDCIERGEDPVKVSPESAAFSVSLIEAERKSAETGNVVEL